MKMLEQKLDVCLEKNEISLVHVIISHVGNLCTNCNCFDVLNDDKLCEYCDSTMLNKKNVASELNQMILGYQYDICRLKGLYMYPHFTVKLHKYMDNTIYDQIWGYCKNCLQQEYHLDLDDNGICEVCVDYMYDQLESSDDESSSV